jgi:hypothetical protein
VTRNSRPKIGSMVRPSAIMKCTSNLWLLS